MLDTSIVVLASVVLAFVPLSDGCTCLFRHPQEVVCKSDFVIKGVQVEQNLLPVGDEFPNIGGRLVFKILIQAVIKGANLEPGDIIEVRTGSSSAACGVNVTPGVTWLLTGRTILGDPIQYGISLCDWNTPCPQLTPQQASFLRSCQQSYFGRNNINCERCEIVTCPNRNCSTTTPEAGQCITDGNRCFSQTLKCEYTNNCCQWGGRRRDVEECAANLRTVTLQNGLDVYLAGVVDVAEDAYSFGTYLRLGLILVNYYEGPHMQ